MVRMRAGRVLAASVVVHAALFGALSQITVEGKRVQLDVPPRIGLVDPVRTAEPAVFDVVVLDTQASPSMSTATSTSTSTSTSRTIATAGNRGRANIAATAAPAAAEPDGHGEGHGHGHGQGQGQGQGMMSMRGPDLGLAPGTGERIVATSRPLPVEPKVSGKLKSAPGGRAISDDAVTTMSVEQDGSVTFADKPDIEIKLALPIPHLDVEGMRKDLGQLLTDWYRDPDAYKKFGRKADVSRVVLAVPGACDHWGDVWCDDPSAPKQEKYTREQAKTGGSILAGKLDITSYLHRKLIGDPYSSRKLKLLDDTRDERVAMGTRFKTQQLARAGEIARRNLARIESLSLAEKKEALFELWDECSEGDDAEGQAGQRVRALVLGFIRTHLPDGSPSAYTAAEIAALHAKRSSKQAFAPYQAEPEVLELHETMVPDEH